MARPRKTIKEKELAGTYRKDREKKPVELTGTALDIKPPTFLSTMAKKEWKILLSVLDQRILLQADSTMLAMLSISIYEFKRQTIALQNEGMVLSGKPSPRIKLVDKARKDILELSQHFGLSPKTRAGIELPPQPQEASGLEKLMLMK
jgi:P27 family predicted phage terminase small subunit